jgi:hypothetical protein
MLTGQTELSRSRMLGRTCAAVESRRFARLLLSHCRGRPPLLQQESLAALQDLTSLRPHPRLLVIHPDHPLHPVHPVILSDSPAILSRSPSGDGGHRMSTKQGLVCTGGVVLTPKGGIGRRHDRIRQAVRRRGTTRRARSAGVSAGGAGVQDRVRCIANRVGGG